MPEAPNLRSATCNETEQTLTHALQFDGSKVFRLRGEMMAKITAAHPLAQLLRDGFVMMKKPPAPPPSALV